MMNLRRIHQFWFEEIHINDAYYERKVPLWFLGPHPEIDLTCQQEFAPWLSDLSLEDALKVADPTNYLCQVLLFDQIPRNAFRGKAKAFAYDKIAQRLCLNALDTPLEDQLSFPEKLFLYLPLEHAEDMALQNLCVEKFQALHASAPDTIHRWTQLALDKAIEHRRTIEEYGCFPHRAKTD